MSKKFEREDKVAERLQKENRELKSHIRTLEKRLKKLNKGYNKILEYEEEMREEGYFPEIIQEVKKLCFDCNTGELEKKIILNRYYRECNKCGKRTKAKLIT